MRRPPDPQLLGFLEAYDRPIADLALALREIILEEVPDASESIYQVYTVAIWFGFSGKMKDMFCYIATNARHLNLGFPRGSTLPDPNRVLEGDGKTMRHIKFASQRDLERSFVRRYIHASIEQLGAAAAGKGVETSEQLNQLCALKCDQTQGYLFSKPVESGIATEMLKSFAFPEEARESQMRLVGKRERKAVSDLTAARLRLEWAQSNVSAISSI